MTNLSPKPFRIDVPQDTLDDLRYRLQHARLPHAPEGAGWSRGTDDAFMQRLRSHWLDKYEWRKHEAALNAFPQFVADVNGTKVHFLHVRGKGPNPTPLLLIHAYPDSFFRFVKALGPLTDPAAHGGDPSLSFDVIIPSLPGFGFSDPTPMSVDATADLFAALMKGLGYTRYLAGGGDGPIPIAMSQRHAAELAGIYSVDVGYPDGSTDFASLGPEEGEFAQWIQSWWMRDGAFNMIQSTKPQSLAYALNDSPLGLAAWLDDPLREQRGGAGRGALHARRSDHQRDALLGARQHRLRNGELPRERARRLGEPERAEAGAERRAGSVRADAARRASASRVGGAEGQRRAVHRDGEGRAPLFVGSAGGLCPGPAGLREQDSKRAGLSPFGVTAARTSRRRIP